jgi:hypothetical protein
VKITVHYFLYPLCLVLLIIQTARLHNVDQRQRDKSLAAQKVFFRCIQRLPECHFANPAKEGLDRYGCYDSEAINKLEADYGQIVEQ